MIFCELNIVIREKIPETNCILVILDYESQKPQNFSSIYINSWNV